MKGERVAQLELILKAHPEGLRKADIARRIGVHRSTVGRYIEDLKNFSNVYEENDLVKLEIKDTEEQLALSVYESLALNMGAEMLLSNGYFKSPHLTSGLRKIAMNIQSYAPKIAKNIAVIADEAEKRLSAEGKDKYNTVFDVLIDAWVSGRMVRIEHIQNGMEEETELAPYFIGFVDNENGRNPITLTGRLRHTTEIVTLDISRIRKVEILNETYTIPDNLRVFRNTEDSPSVNSVVDTVDLVLRVSEKSALNSFRTLAHSKISIEKTDNSKYLCRFKAENSIELFLRIIQCGNSVEIVAPEHFRTKFIADVQQILETYEGSFESSSSLKIF